MRDIYAILCDEIAKICKNCGNLQKLRFDEKPKRSDSPNTLFSVGEITSLHNVPMATGGNGCSCVK